MPVQQTKRGEQTRLRITQTAAELIHRQGFYHTSLDDILAAAGVPKGSLYFHFKNKNELGRAVIRYRREFLLESLRQIFEQEGALDDHIRQWFAFMESTQRTPGGCFGCPIGNLAQELSREGGVFAEEIDQFFLQAERLVETRLQQAQRTREIRFQIQSKELASFLLMASQGALLLAKTRNSLAPLKEARQTVLRLLNNLAPRQAKKKG